MLKLHTWQVTARDLFMERKKGVIQGCTASGKTIFACSTILEVGARITHVVVPRVQLINQWCEEFRKLGYAKPIGKFGGKHGAENDWHEINVWTIDTARKYINNPEYGGENTMLVVDECHRSTSPTRRKIYQMKPEYCLGISATAFQGGTYLVNLIGGGLLYNYTFEDALADGVVNDYEIHHVGFQLSDDNREMYDMATEDIKLTRRLIKSAYDGQYPNNPQNWPTWVAEMAATSGDPLFIRLQQLWLERKRALWCDPARVLITLDIIRNNPGERVVVFHQQIEQCDEIAKRFRKHGIVCGVEHSGLPMSERRATIEGFRKGEFDILITCRTLDEGFNVPNISMGIIAASSSTSTQMIQRVGRVVRKAAKKGKSLIYRLSATGTVDDFATSNLVSSGSIAPHRVRQYTYSGNVISALSEERGIVWQPTHYASLLRTNANTFDYQRNWGGRARLHLPEDEHNNLSSLLDAHGMKSGKFNLLSDGSILIWKRRWVSIGISSFNSEYIPLNAHWRVWAPEFKEENPNAIVKIYTKEEIKDAIK